MAASFHNVASSGTSSVTPSDGNNDVTVSKENGCDHKNEQPEEAEKKPDVPKKDDIESEQTKNTATKDEQPKQSDKDEQQVKADDLTKDADKDETQHVLSDSESTRGGKGETRPSRRQRTVSLTIPLPKQANVERIEVEGVVTKSEERDASDVLH